MGSETCLHLKTGKQTFTFRVEAHRKREVSQKPNLAILMSKPHLFVTETEKVVV